MQQFQGLVAKQFELSEKDALAKSKSLTMAVTNELSNQLE